MHVNTLRGQGHSLVATPMPSHHQQGSLHNIIFSSEMISLDYTPPQDSLPARPLTLPLMPPDSHSFPSALLTLSSLFTDKHCAPQYCTRAHTHTHTHTHTHSSRARTQQYKSTN